MDIQPRCDDQKSALSNEDAKVLRWLETDAPPRRRWLEKYYARLCGLRHANWKSFILLRHFLASILQSVGVLLAGYLGPMQINHAWWLVLTIWIFRLIDLWLQIAPTLKRSTHFKEVDHVMMRVAELLSESAPALHVDNADQRERNKTVITAILSLIEGHARHLVNAPSGSLTVTFARYIEGHTRLDLSLRNRGSLRPQAQVIPEDFILGHLVCKRTNQTRTVHDLHDFPEFYHKSPTGNDAKYRSFMIFPVTKLTGDDASPLGFVSIDCEIPYAFYGDRAKILVATVGPIIKQIVQRMEMEDQK